MTDREQALRRRIETRFLRDLRDEHARGRALLDAAREQVERGPAAALDEPPRDAAAPRERGGGRDPRDPAKRHRAAAPTDG